MSPNNFDQTSSYVIVNKNKTIKYSVYLPTKVSETLIEQNNNGIVTSINYESLKKHPNKITKEMKELLLIIRHIKNKKIN